MGLASRLQRWQEPVRRSQCWNLGKRDGVSNPRLLVRLQRWYEVILTAILAGEYPVYTKDVARELHLSGDAGSDEDAIRDIHYGKRTGLYDLVIGRGQNVLRGKGSYTNTYFRNLLVLFNLSTNLF